MQYSYAYSLAGFFSVSIGTTDPGGANQYYVAVKSHRKTIVLYSGMRQRDIGSAGSPRFL